MKQAIIRHGQTSLYSTKKRQQVKFGNHGKSDDRIRSFKEKVRNLKEESYEDRLQLASAWDKYAKANGVGFEYRYRRKEVRIA